MLKQFHGRQMQKPDTPESEKKATSTPDANGADVVNGDALVIRMPVDVRSVSLSIIAALAGILALQYAQSVLIPVVLGVLLSYAFSPMVTSLARLHVPRAIGAALAVSLLVGSIGVGVYTLSDEAGAIIAKVPEAAQRIRQRVAAQRSQRGTAILQQVQDAAKEIEKTADAATKPVEDTRASRTGRDQLQQVEVVEPAFRASDYIWIGGVGLFGFLGQFAVILFLVYFLLVTGDLYKRKLVKIAGPTLSKKRVTVQILDEINQQIESFIKVQFITSLIVAVATGLTLWAFGVENYAMWGLLAGLFNSIPYLGPLARHRRTRHRRVHAVQRRGAEPVCERGGVCRSRASRVCCSRRC